MQFLLYALGFLCNVMRSVGYGMRNLNKRLNDMLWYSMHGDLEQIHLCIQKSFKHLQSLPLICYADIYFLVLQKCRNIRKIFKITVIQMQ